MIGAIATLMQLVAVEPRLPELPKLTPASVTQPIHEFRCRVVGPSSEPFGLTWRRIGERGYFKGSSDAEGRQLVGRTKVSYEIVDDESGRLSSMQFLRFGGFHQVGSIFKDSSGSTAVFRTDFDGKSGWGSLSMYLYAVDASDPELIAGPCQVIEIEQAPLEHAPEIES